MKNSKLTMGENAETIENFLFNFLFILVHQVPVDNTNKYNLAYRQALLEKIKTFKEKHQINDKILELLRKRSLNSSIAISEMDEKP